LQAGEENPNPQRNPQWRKGKPKTRAKRRSSEEVDEERRKQKETETRKKKSASFYSAAFPTLSYCLRSAREEGNRGTNTRARPPPPPAPRRRTPSVEPNSPRRHLGGGKPHGRSSCRRRRLRPLPGRRGAEIRPGLGCSAVMVRTPALRSLGFPAFLLCSGPPRLGISAPPG